MLRRSNYLGTSSNLSTGQTMNAPISPFRLPDHPVDDLFIARWSPRAFADAAMTEGDVLTVLEAARWAPSASNLQPWRFVWGLRGDAGFAAIADALVPFNRGWAERAAALVVVASKTTVLRDEGPAANGYHAFDAGAAWGHLALQAHLSGFVAHAMGGFDRAKAGESLHLPADHVIHAVVALGRRGDPAGLPDGLKSRETPSSRLPLAEIARRGRFA